VQQALLISFFSLSRFVPNESLQWGIPKEEFSRMIFEKKIFHGRPENQESREMDKTIRLVRPSPVIRLGLRNPRKRSWVRRQMHSIVIVVAPLVRYC